MEHITADPADIFSKTFRAKADMQDQWDFCMGAWESEVLLGALIVTISKRAPKVANLQLLHTFAASRGRGVGRLLTEYALLYSLANEAEYFRVSAEPSAVDFYKKCGMKFWGKQKSGSSLCMFKIGGDKYTDGIYTMDDVMEAAFTSNRKGSIVSGVDIAE